MVGQGEPRYEAGDRLRVDCGLYTGCRGYIVGVRWGDGDWEYQLEMDDGTFVWKFEDELR